MRYSTLFITLSEILLKQKRYGAVSPRIYLILSKRGEKRQYFPYLLNLAYCFPVHELSRARAGKVRDDKSRGTS